MNPARWQQIKSAFDGVVDLDPELRLHFIDKMCADDEELREQVESLLAAHEQAGGFLTTPPAALEAFEDLAGDDPWVGQHIGPYRLVRELGSGGMGEVYLAMRDDAEFDQQVAIKLIRNGQESAEVVSRFKTERQILASLDHPNIAKLLDGGRTQRGQPYFVMEYVPGLPITEYCDRHRLKVRARIELLIQACEGVQHAHQNAIIHRDLKPSNILIVEVDGKSVPRIIDFGIAKATTPAVPDHTQLTRFGHFIGTPGYMSPEQTDPNVRVIDTRTDVYSLGVILYVLLTGMQPFETPGGKTAPFDEWLRRLREDEPQRPSGKVGAGGDASGAAAARGTEPKQLAGLLRGDLDSITLKALERDRERRYGTPLEFAADLRHYLQHEPVVARPATAVYQVRKFMRRHRLAAAVAGGVVLLAITASGAGLLAVRKQHEAEYQTRQARLAESKALQAQARLLTQSAAQRLKEADVAGAQSIILEVLTNPAFAETRTPSAIAVFQEVRAADQQLAVLSGHGDAVYSAAYSPDGARIVTASRDKTARIWDARTGIELAALSGHSGAVFHAAYSPDGTRIVTASQDKTARIWDARTGTSLAVLAGHDGDVNAAVYSPDGARIVTASDDRTARIWDARTGERLAVLTGHGAHVMSAAYSPDGTRIVTTSDDKTARIWDASSGRQLAVLAGHSELVSSAAYSPDGTRIVTASTDKTARIWEASTGREIAVLSGHGRPVYSATYSPDGTRIVTASVDKTARIWDALSGAQLAVLAGHSYFVQSAVYSPDGTRIVTASYDHTARIWDARTGMELATLSRPVGRLFHAAYSPDATRVVTASEDDTARIWNAATGAQVAVLSGHGYYVYDAAYSPDGTRVVTASFDKTARIWDARTGAPLAVLAGHADRVVSADFSPDGTRIVTTSSDKTARIWDALTYAQLAVLSGHGDFVYSAAYSPDGTRIVTASQDHTVRIWDAHSGACLAVLAGHDSAVYSAAYSPDGARIVTASGDKTARVWDGRTGAQLTVLSGHGEPVTAAAFSPDGTRIVTASVDKTARLWDARTGAQLNVLSGHHDSVGSAVYSPDGTRILTASYDKSARIWDARVQAGLAAQILWDASAETDPLPEADRNQLGIPSDLRARVWPQGGSACDLAAAAVYDPDRATPGVSFNDIAVDVANRACAAEAMRPDHSARADYQLGRVLAAKGDGSGARRQFDIAVASGYRTARIDLADLMLNASAKPIDPGRAVTLYERAWQEGVSIAAFRLGHLYEYGLRDPDVAAPAALRPDEAAAWSWYRKGADAGEPNALARLAARDERAALDEPDPANRHAQLLQAFSLYAAAAEHAHAEDWPVDASKLWRHRRATLARLLAGEGLMQQVADAYATVLDQAPSRSSASREHTTAMFRR